MSALLNNWVPQLHRIETAASFGNRQINASSRSITKKLSNVFFLSAAFTMKEVLDILSVLSLKLERKSVLACDVSPAVSYRMESFFRKIVFCTHYSTVENGP